MLHLILKNQVQMVGDDVAYKKFSDRTPQESENFGRWCDCLKWYIALRRSGYDVSFTDPS
jgi:hypothetical protein